MKGQQQVLTTVLLTGVLITIVGSIYLWGLPLIRKNQAAATLEHAELFMKNLNEKIKFIANNGGRDQITISVPGVLGFYNSSDIIPPMLMLTVRSEGTIYELGGNIPLIGRNCDANINGTWGVDKPEILCVQSSQVGKGDYTTIYFIQYRNLTSGDKIYQINLIGDSSHAGTDHKVVIENVGTNTISSGGNILIQTQVKITII